MPPQRKPVSSSFEISSLYMLTDFLSIFEEVVNTWYSWYLRGNTKSWFVEELKYLKSIGLKTSASHMQLQIHCTMIHIVVH